MRDLIAIVENQDHLVATEDLPPAVRKEAELTIDENFWNNVEGDLFWTLRRVRVADVANEDHHTALESDEGYFRRAKRIAASMAQHGQKTPIVVGPSGIEGNGRIGAAILLNWRWLDAWVSIIVESD